MAQHNLPDPGDAPGARFSPALAARLLIYAAVLATIAVYWPGLKGPFILDDPYNLAPLQDWLDGRASALELFFGNSSGVLGRPVSMASLWLSLATGGMHPFPFKFGNLLIHLACGLVGWQMLRRLLSADATLERHSTVLAATLAALWLLHPINVSTVLYSVQRMAQLSTFFALVAVWLYVLARTQLAARQRRSAAVNLFLVFPSILLLGIFSKENAAVIPLLCLVVEIAYFRPNPSERRILVPFYALFLLVPGAMALWLLAASPETLLGLYATRDFTLAERLLSQPRALMEYLGLYVWPRGGMMGVYVDDFAISRGLLAPPSTFAALVALLAISVGAWRVRRLAPSVFAGWFFFLAAQSVESSILPLELYFEHRNYLPGFGLLLALCGLIALARDKLRGGSRLLIVVPVAVAAISLAAITWQQVQVWRGMPTIVAQALEHRPTSFRANLEMASQEIHLGRWDDARVRMQRLTTSADASQRLTGIISSIVIDCLQHGQTTESGLSQAEAVPLQRVTLTEVLTLRPLSKALAEGRCTGISSSRVATTVIALLDKAEGQPDTSKPKWLLRTLAAELYMRDRRYREAITQAEMAWQTNADTGIGAFLTRLYIAAGMKPEALRTWAEVKRRTRSYEVVANRELTLIREQIERMPD
ncbi:hypothetical protein [Luteimonas sp. SDU82]|uniref:hypothetical protein n=1 Tax=Luteimonas sp. SDU82 TaxID=3422592 RepID=UPI003EBCB857